MLKGTLAKPPLNIIRQLPTPTAFLDENLNLVCASDSWLDLHHFSANNSFGRHITELFPDIQNHWIDILEACLAGKGGHTGTERVIVNEGQEIWLEYVNNPWFAENGSVAGVLLQITDTTHIVEEEIKNQKTEMLLTAMSELAQIGSWEYDVERDVLKWGEMTRKIHEVSEDFVPTLENGIQFYKEGYSRNTITQCVYRAIDTGQPWSEKLQVITAKGREIWVIASGKAVYKNGEYIGLIGTFQDVTDITLSEQKIAESERLLRTVVDNLPLNVYIKDLESRKTLVNKSECAYLGVTDPKELIGKSDVDLYDEKMAQISRDEDLYVMNNGKSIIGKETISVRKDGSTTYFLSSKIPLLDSGNQVYGLLGVSLDITDLKQKEMELRELIDVTSRQNKKLLNFAHIVSHNLRSHSANFSMLLELLESEKDPAEAGRIVGMLTTASDNLMETLENLNEVVAINTNTEIRKTPVNLRNTVKRVEDELAAYLGANGALLHNDLPGDLIVDAIPAYMDNILTNLITNAVKYRHPDRVPEIRISARKSGGKVELCIADNGIGIDLDKYGDKLFGMYKTFHDHPDAKGIGLYITKNQIEAMQAHIMTCSEVDMGTTFKIYFNDTH